MKVALGLLGWVMGDRQRRRGPGSDLVLPQLPAISKTCVTPKKSSAFTSAIFQVDQPAPSASGGGWERSRGP